MPYVTHGMSFDYVIESMKYLGYVVTDENGGLTQLAMNTANALTDATSHGSMLPSQIATEYARQKDIRDQIGFK